jgi:DNA-binding Lrp family transcriptional regulator
MISNSNTTHFPDQPREDIFRASRQQKVMALVRKFQRKVLDDPQNIWYRHTDPVIRIRERGITLGHIQRQLVHTIHEYIMTTDQNPYFFKQSAIASFLGSNQPRINEAIKSLEEKGIIWNFQINWNKRVRGILVPVGGLRGWHLGSDIFPMAHSYTVLVSKLAKYQRNYFPIISNIKRVRCHFVPSIPSPCREKKLQELRDDSGPARPDVSQRVLALLIKTYWFEPNNACRKRREFATLPIKRHELKIKGHAAAIRAKHVGGRRHIDPEVYYGLNLNKNFKVRHDSKNTKFDRINKRCQEKLMDLCNNGVSPDIPLTTSVLSYWYRAIPKKLQTPRPKHESVAFKKLVVAITWLKWKQGITKDQFHDTIHWMRENGKSAKPWRFLNSWEILSFFIDQGNNWLKYLLRGNEIKRAQYLYGPVHTDYAKQVEVVKRMFVHECWGDPDNAQGHELMARFDSMITRFIDRRIDEFFLKGRHTLGLKFAVPKGLFTDDPSIMQLYCMFMNRVIWEEREFKPVKEFCDDANWNKFLDYFRSKKIAYIIDFGRAEKSWVDRSIEWYSGFWKAKRIEEEEPENNF